MTCIYCREEDLAKLRTEDHIFSAGLGGKIKLPLGYVCDDCNTKRLSSIELKFMKYSLPSLPRQFYGPGKRGSISGDKATESEIHILATSNNLNDYGLGYVKLGNPEFIDQIIFRNDNTLDFILSKDKKEDVDLAISELIQSIKQFNTKFYFIELSEEEYSGYSIIGYYDKKYYVADRNRESASIQINNLKQLLSKAIDISKYSEQIVKSQVRSHQKLILDLDIDSRVICKMGFNLFAAAKNDKYVLDQKFDSTRDYIIGNSTEQRNPFIVPNAFSEHFLSILPTDSHFLILCNFNEKTYCHASFYGSQITYTVELFPFEEPVDMIGLVIDWKNSRDYLFFDYLNSLNTK